MLQRDRVVSCGQPRHRDRTDVGLRTKEPAGRRARAIAGERSGARSGLFRAAEKRARRSAGFRRLLHAPKLEALAVDRLLDGAPRQVVGWRAVWPDHAGGLPGTVLRRQLAAGRIAREGAQLAVALGLEHENVHRSVLSTR